MFWRQLKKFNQLCHKTKGGCSNTKSGHSNNLKDTCKMAPPTAVTPSTIIETSQVTTATTTPPVPTTTTEAATPRTEAEQLEKWVKNLSGVPLTRAQMSLLAYGPNFATALRHPPWGIHCHCEADLLEPGATQCRRTESRNKGNPKIFTSPGGTSPRKRPRPFLS